jgi:Raf kinase inhibitor-like YbhB/YbcL family protein
MRKQFGLSLGTVVLVLAILACNTPTPATDLPSSPPTDGVIPSTATGTQSAAPSAPTASPEPTATKAPFELTSPAFTQGNVIPTQYTCDGRDISPALAWGDPPEGTKSFALIMDDPDAPGGTWVHWVLFNIPPEARGLPEDLPRDAQFADGSLNGNNSWNRLGYDGPCPPSGTHRYFFKLYALDILLDLPSGTKKLQLTPAMEGHILGQLELMGIYFR